MEPIKVEINVNVNLSEETKQFVASLLANGAVSSAPAAEPEAQQETKTPKRATAPKPAAPKPAPAPEPEPQPAAPAPEPEPQPENDGSAELTITQVRDACKAKLKTHQDELRKKLQELGAPNISTLDAKHYRELFDFANSLS